MPPGQTHADTPELDDSLKAAEAEQERLYFEEEDGPWYIGKAKEEFRRRKTARIDGKGEEDPIQVS